MIDDIIFIDELLEESRLRMVGFLASRMVPVQQKEFWPKIESIGNDMVSIRANGFFKEEQCYALSKFFDGRKMAYSVQGRRTIIVNETELVDLLKKV